MPPPAPSAEIGKLAQGVRSGDRSLLSRAITLTESKRADHRRAESALKNEGLRQSLAGEPAPTTGAPPRR